MADAVDSVNDSPLEDEKEQDITCPVKPCIIIAGARRNFAILATIALTLITSTVGFVVRSVRLQSAQQADISSLRMESSHSQTQHSQLVSKEQFEATIGRVDSKLADIDHNLQLLVEMHMRANRTASGRYLPRTRTEALAVSAILQQEPDPDVLTWYPNRRLSSKKQPIRERAPMRPVIHPH